MTDRFASMSPTVLDLLNLKRSEEGISRFSTINSRDFEVVNA